ncbi:MAG: hypothetical protein KIT34_14775 [Cyanobacteria bacterium TGS_CYA1]|nr:hypothetical protein [Cyanobacteria bacterium TGS_CYA1]
MKHMVNKVILIVFVLCGCGLIGGWIWRSSATDPPEAYCVLDKTVEVDQKIAPNTTLFFSFVDKQKAFIHVVTPVPVKKEGSRFSCKVEHSLLELDLKSWELSPSTLIPADYKIEIVESLPGENEFKILLSKGDKMKALVLNSDGKIELEFKFATSEEKNSSRIFKKGNYFIVSTPTKLMRWKIKPNEFERLSDIALPGSSSEPPSISESISKTNELVMYRDSSNYSINLETAKITKEAVKQNFAVHRLLHPVVYQTPEKVWGVEKETLRCSLLVGKNFEVDSLKLHTMIHGQREFVSTGFQPLDSLLVSMKAHTIYENKNWPYPPTEFNSLAFDKNGKLLLLTDEEGLFILIDDHWKRLFNTHSLNLSKFKQMKVLPDNKILMLTWSGSGGLFSAPSEQVKDGIVLFDPADKKYKVLRIRWTSG